MLPTFRDAYALRRCIVPVDGFFEWRAMRGAHGKQPYAIAMKDNSPFGLAGLWENWRNPNTGEWERTFAVITVPSNELVAQIHDRMPAILERSGYERWLGTEADPHDLLSIYPSELMMMWPISTRVNKPENDDPSLLDRVGDPMGSARFAAQRAGAPSEWVNSWPTAPALAGEGGYTSMDIRTTRPGRLRRPHKLNEKGR
jgi:putative SOS response-associated peptidase YedK